jgi:hypothetical protein
MPLGIPSIQPRPLLADQPKLIQTQDQQLDRRGGSHSQGLVELRQEWYDEMVKRIPMDGGDEKLEKTKITKPDPGAKNKAKTKTYNMKTYGEATPVDERRPARRVAVPQRTPTRGMPQVPGRPRDPGMNRYDGPRPAPTGPNRRDPGMGPAPGPRPGPTRERVKAKPAPPTRRVTPKGKYAK